MKADRTDLAAAALLVALGAYFGLSSLSLPMGTTFRMGPGYFPLVLAILLVGFGVVIGVQALGRGSQPLGPVSWRGILLTCGATVAFGVLVAKTGLVPALVVAILTSAFASVRMTLKLALALTFCLTLFCVAVFKFGLGLPVPLFGAS